MIELLKIKADGQVFELVKDKPELGDHVLELGYVMNVLLSKMGCNPPMRPLSRPQIWRGEEKCVELQHAITSIVELPVVIREGVSLTEYLIEHNGRRLHFSQGECRYLDSNESRSTYQHWNPHPPYYHPGPNQRLCQCMQHQQYCTCYTGKRW